MKSISVPVVAALVWLFASLVIDRMILSNYCPVCDRVLTLELKCKLPAAELTFPPVNLLLLVVLPMTILAVYLIPWSQLLSFNAWREAFSIWSQPCFWLLFALVLTVFSESLYILVREYLPKSLTELARKVSVTSTLSFTVPGQKRTIPLLFTTSLSGFLGLLLGAYLFFKNGL
ncbi:MAG: hypothetical protein ACHQYP_11165, partial [Nitrospiria bacterium]